MPQGIRVRWGWLRFMYAYTIVGAGGFGLGMVVAPNAMQSALGWPSQDRIILGMTGSVLFAFAILSILGLRSPLAFAPVLLLQLCYKLVWFIGVALPLLIAGQLPPHAILPAAVFATYVIGDLIAIPFAYLFAKRPDRQA